MFFRTHFLFCYLLIVLASTAERDITNFDVDRYRAGRDDLAYLKQEADLPRFGKCWLSALEYLEVGCNRLAEDELHKMTFSFMNCFLLKTGREKQECPLDHTIEDCTRLLKSEAYGVYTKFFTHTQNICFFMQAQKWQAVTRLTINKLADTSEAVATQMENSSELQSEIIRRQSDSIRMQEILIRGGADLKRTLDESKIDLDSMMNDFKASSLEQKNLLFDVFDKVRSLQSLVVGEMSGFLSFVFFLASLLICYILTSAPQSSSARIYLFLIMFLNLLVEKLLFSFIQFDDKGTDLNYFITLNEEGYYYSRNVSRTVAVSASVMFLMCTICRYKNYGVLNNNLLRETKEQNNQLKGQLEQNARDSHKMFDQLNEWLMEQKMREEAESDNDSIGYGSDTDSICTLDQTQDKTYTLDTSTMSSSTIDLKEDLRFLYNSTPYKELLTMGSVAPQSTCKSEKLEASQSLDKTLTPTKRYNLRPRHTPTRSCESSELSETPSEFGKKIRSLARESAKTGKKHT